ncbi:MAG: hypothetical protein WC979_00150 [Candidatus Pacearchaeota archaeon]|jgi:hypothetical protein|nr:hypothetical protein [Clostridia bacterium]
MNSNPEQIHDELHKDIYENQKLITESLVAIVKLLENTKFSFNNINEQRQCQNHFNALKNRAKKLNSKFQKNKS